MRKIFMLATIALLNSCGVTLQDSSPIAHVLEEFGFAKEATSGSSKLWEAKLERSEIEQFQRRLTKHAFRFKQVTLENRNPISITFDLIPEIGDQVAVKNYSNEGILVSVWIREDGKISVVEFYD